MPPFQLRVNNVCPLPEWKNPAKSHKIPVGVTVCIIHNDKEQKQPGELEQCGFFPGMTLDVTDSNCYLAYEDAVSSVSMPIVSNANTACRSFGTDP